MITALVAFYCRISDDRLGGTYMTLLNTFSNIGGLSSKLISYALIDLLSVKECSFDSKNNCSTSHLQNVSSYTYNFLFKFIFIRKFLNNKQYW